MFLGGLNLIVGNNNLSTTFSGLMQDGPFFGFGGSLTKIGNGKLTLSKANTYTGGTTVSKGTLLVTNRTGSATGTGAVQVNKGTLGGTGIITGAVTVGTGRSSGAVLLPGQECDCPRHPHHQQRSDLQLPLDLQMRVEPAYPKASESYRSRRDH